MLARCSGFRLDAYGVPEGFGEYWNGLGLGRGNGVQLIGSRGGHRGI